MRWTWAASLFSVYVTTMAGSFAVPAQMMSTIVCYMALANDPSPLFDASAHDPAAASPECTPELVTGETSEAGINAAAPAIPPVYRTPRLNCWKLRDQQSRRTTYKTMSRMKRLCAESRTPRNDRSASISAAPASSRAERRAASILP